MAQDIMSLLIGNKGGNQQLSTLNDQQQQGLAQLWQMIQQSGGGVEQAMKLLQGYLDPNSEQYKNFEAPYMQQFQQQTIPRLAEQFAGMGGGLGGGLSSSGFGQALSAAGGNLQTELARMKSGLGMQAAQGLFNQYNQMTNQGLGTRAFENQYNTGSTGLVGDVASGAASAFVGGMPGMVQNYQQRFGGY